MKTVAHIQSINQSAAAVSSHRASTRAFTLDTTFVLFFLGLEAGRTVGTPSLDVLLLFVALVAVVSLPYFLAGDEKPEFSVWLSGRIWLAAFSVGLGVAFNQAVGTVLPEMLRFAPMSLLIIATVISCQIQFYRFLRVKAA